MAKFLEKKMASFTENKEIDYSIEEYLTLGKTNPDIYATASERMLKAIGEKQLLDTSKNPRLGRIFMNRTIPVYPAFADFYGMEDTIEHIVKYFQHSAQGLEERKQILYLLGPVGGGKSSLAERLKLLMEKEPIYVLTHQGQLSPVFEHPLELFKPTEAAELEAEYGVPQRLITGLLSPWGVKRLDEAKGDLTKFGVRKIFPSKLRQICISKVEPGDENNQDISTMVGKVDIRKLEKYSLNDPDAYSYSGGLNRTTQGLMEFVEMFKAPIKMLHPLLTATQEGNYIGTENIGAIPFRGIILAHCFSEDTQLLTQNGWKNHWEIDLGDLLATMNRTTGFLEYQPAIKKFEQHYAGEMIHFESNSTDHLVTPNHKMIYHTQYTNDWREVYANEFGETGKIIPVSAKNLLPDYDISDNMLRLMVWIVADGSLIDPKGTLPSQETKKNYQTHQSVKKYEY